MQSLKSTKRGTSSLQVYYNKRIINYLNLNQLTFESNFKLLLQVFDYLDFKCNMYALQKGIFFTRKQSKDYLNLDMQVVFSLYYLRRSKLVVTVFV